MPSLSVIICTHNPRADYLRRTLASLQAQTLPRDQWELVLIDNASREPLTGTWSLAWHPAARIVVEARLGLTEARLAAIRATTTDLLLFIDDDNVVAPDYLERLLALAATYPWLGCLGAGVLEPEFEEEPAAELRFYCQWLALRTVTEPQWSNIPDDSCNPWGAGLAARRPVAQKYLEATEAVSPQLRLDRQGDVLISGGDEEFSYQACALNYGKGIFPELRITHLIDRRRVQPSYLERLEEGHGFTDVLRQHLRNHSQPSQSGAKGRLLWFLGTIAAHLCRNRDAIVAYRMQAARRRGIQKGLAFLQNSQAGSPRQPR